MTCAHLPGEIGVLASAAYEAVLSIAESLPCRECDENQKHWDNAPGELRGFTDCPNGGHPDPATVAARLPKVVEALKETEAVLSAMMSSDAWPPERLAPRLARLRTVVAAALSAKPQEPASALRPGEAQ